MSVHMGVGHGQHNCTYNAGYNTCQIMVRIKPTNWQKGQNTDNVPRSVINRR